MTTRPPRVWWLPVVLGVCVALVDAPYRLWPEAGCLLLLAVLATQRRRFAAGNTMLVGLLFGWLALSFLWSVQPMGTFRSVLRTGLLVGAAWLLTRTQPRDRIAGAVSLGTGLLSLASLASLATSPTTAIDLAGLRGIMPQNNALAYLAGIGVATGVVTGVRVRGRARLLQALLAAVNLATLALSSSVTSWLSTVVALLAASAVLLFRRLQGARRTAAGVLVGGVALAMGYLSAFVPLTSVLGRDATLTGRTDIWPEVLELADQRWLMGWGHGAPWVKGSWIRDWAAFHFNFSMISAHNAALETYLQLGLVGLVLVTLLWVRGLFRSVGDALVPGASVWLVAMAAYHLLHGVAEASQGSPLAWLIVGLIWMCPTVRGSLDEVSQGRPAASVPRRAVQAGRSLNAASSGHAQP